MNHQGNPEYIPPPGEYEPSPSGAAWEAEAGVIGSMLMNPQCVGSVLTRLHADDFSPGNAPLVAAISTLFETQQRVDAVTVLGEMRRVGTFREETRRQVLELVEITPTAANVEEYVRIVEEQSRLRRVRERANRLLTARSLDEVPPVLEELAGVLRQEERRDVEDMAEGITRLFQWLEDERPVETIPTSLPQLDRQLWLEQGMYLILAGNPSDGKTLLALQMALTMAKSKKVGFFSFETNKEKLMRRMVPCFTGVSASRLRSKAVNQEDMNRMVRASAELSALTLDRVHASGYTVADIRALTAARGYQVIFVDYLQIVRPDNPRDPDVRQLQLISRQLHELAQSLGVLVIALSQFSWETQKQSRAPRVSDLKGASEIEQNADVILLLSKAGLSKGGGTDWERKIDQRRLPAGTELRLLQVAKNKDGERGTYLHLLLRGDVQRMEYYQPPAAGMEREPPVQKVPDWVQMAMENPEDVEEWEDLP